MKSGIYFLKTRSGYQKEKEWNFSADDFSVKSLLTAVVLLAGIGFSSAQENFQWGVKAGVNASTQAELGNLCDNNRILAGFNAGVAGRYGFNNWLGISTELGFQAKGTVCDKTGTDVTNRLTYLLLPVKAEFSASEKAGLKNGQRVFFATGPYAGYLLNAKQINNDVKTDLDMYNNFDFGWSFELGYKFPVLKKNALQFSLNYDMGIAEVASGTNSNNKSASFNVAWWF